MAFRRRRSYRRRVVGRRRVRRVGRRRSYRSSRRGTRIGIRM